MGLIYQEGKQQKNKRLIAEINLIRQQRILDKKTVKKRKPKKKQPLKIHKIDCDAEPFCPPGWTVETHIKGGKISFKTNPFFLYMSERQKNGLIEGMELQADLLGKQVANANVLDYLHKHQKIIPQEWFGSYISFWGTIYRDIEGMLCVRCLYHNERGWHFAYSRIKRNYWDDNDQVVIIKSRKKAA